MDIIPPVWGAKIHYHRQQLPIYRRKFLEFCDDRHIRVDWATVTHPQTNGQVNVPMA
jgi:hypothetical protein